MNNKNNIPEQVKKIANKNGCNTIIYRGKYKDKDVYSISYKHPDGTVIPTGLPTILLYNEEGYKIVCGLESFDYY